MFWLLRMLVTANWSEKKNPRQHAESVAFPFNIKTHKLFIFNSLFIFPALLCKPESTCVCLYTHFKPHDLPESPDEAKWKWVQQSYDWSRRNQPHYNHSTTFFFFPCLQREGTIRVRLCSNPKPTSSSDTRPVIWCQEHTDQCFQSLK